MNIDHVKRSLLSLDFRKASKALPIDALAKVNERVSEIKESERRDALKVGLAGAALAFATLTGTSVAEATILFENVLFLDSAASTTTKRSVAARWGELFFNVKSYGATGDGVTNDWAAITAAKTALLSAGGMGILFFPLGTYIVDQPLDFTSNAYQCIVLLGEGGLTELHSSTPPAAGSLIKGSVDGYIIDRFQIFSANGAFRCIDSLGVINTNTSGGGAIRWLGTDVGFIRNCDVSATLGGITVGWDGSPPSATFTGTTSGTSTTMVVTGCSGTISNVNGSIEFPVPLGPTTGVTSPTSFIAQVSGTPGGNGTYTTDNPCTCPGGVSITTHPNAPTDYCMMIEGNKVNGNHAFNSDPDLSFTGIGIQGCPEVKIVNNHVNNWAVAIAMYGGGGAVNNNQCEVNTYGIRIGVDAVGNLFPMINGTVMGNALESNYIGLDVQAANSVFFAGNNGQGTQDPGVHNSKYGTRIRSTQNCTFASEAFGGDYTDAALYFSNPEYRSTLFLTCSYSNGLAANVDKEATCTYAEIKAIWSPNFPTLSATLAQLVAMSVAHGLTVGDRFLMSDSTIAPASQVYNASTTGTGTGSNLASVWWDGTIFRYG